VAIEGFCIAFDDPMLDTTPVWTRLDTGSLVASYSIRRGRQDELAKTGTGTATVELNDRNGLFDPNNVSGPYFGKLDGKQAALALWHPIDEAWVTLFRGFVDSWEYELDPSGLVSRVQVELVDALDYLAGVELVPGTAGQPPPSTDSEGDVYYELQEVDDRIVNVLGNAAWPSSLSTIFSGNVFVKETFYPPGTTALAALADAADAEFPGVANVFVDKLGNVTFHGRHARFDPDSVSDGTAWDFHRWRCGDGEITNVDATYAQLRRLGFSRPRKNIINAAMALPDRNPARIIDPGPPEVPEPALTAAEIIGNIVSDATSRTAYGVHSWSAENLLTWGHKTSGTDDLEETKLFADYYLENYKQPVTRITQLGFRSIRPDDFRGPATWDLLTGVDISDAILVFVNYPGGDGFENEEFFIEGITYDVQPLLGENADPHYADVTLSLDVSPSAFYTIAPDGW